MEVYNAEQFSGKALDHLGLVADTMDELGLLSFFDEKLPLNASCGVKVSMGERVAAMIFNGLGFINTRLYMFPDFLATKPVARLFGKPLEPAWFNDDALGRCLDAIHAYGTTKLFTEFSLGVALKKGFLGKSIHLDTSTLQLYGEYDSEEPSTAPQVVPSQPSPPIPARGHSKSHRHDLKQMVINLATTGSANFPIWMESHSGYASDKVILPDSAVRMNELCKNLAGMPDILYVGDSAMYANILEHSEHLKWLSRVPENIKEAKDLLLRPDSELTWVSLPEGYSYHVTESKYKQVKQRWVMIFSKQAYLREVKTLERNIGKEKKEFDKKWWHLSNELFSCANDATLAAQELAKEMKYHKAEFHTVSITKHTGKGRPPKGAVPETTGYNIVFSLSQDADKVHAATRKKGRFILGTNELSTEVLPDNQMLSEYKEQAGTERGFKFIKDSSFELSTIFLKSAARIDALMMIMTLCLMVYGVAQYNLREALQKAGETIPDQKHQPTNKPSMKFVYWLFSNVQELTIDTGEVIQKFVVNLNAVLKQILRHCGPRARAIYLNSA